METRSQRRAAQNQRPVYPQSPSHSAPNSTSSSAFPSSSSVASLNPNGFNQQPTMLQPGLSSAPLPSPSGPQPATYFGSLAQAAPMSQQQQQRIPSSQQNAPGSTYLGQRGDGGGMPETAPFLQGSSLLAEAAKRAQMACLTRDLGDVGL